MTHLVFRVEIGDLPDQQLRYLGPRSTTGDHESCLTILYTLVYTSQVNHIKE